MKSLKYILLLFIVLIISIIIGYIGYKIYDSTSQINKLSRNEQNIIQNDKIVNATREKVSPNAKVIIRTYYEKCSHDEEKDVELPVEMVNCTQEEVESKYKELELESFSADRLVFLKKEDGICNNHYILKDVNNEINIYKLKNNEEEVFFDNTSISTEYLSEFDLEKLKKGIKVYGKEELNSILEDFE